MTSEMRTDGQNRNVTQRIRRRDFPGCQRNEAERERERGWEAWRGQPRRSGSGSHVRAEQRGQSTFTPRQRLGRQRGAAGEQGGQSSHTHEHRGSGTRCIP